MAKLKKDLAVRNFLFKVPATLEGLEFIRQARTMLNPDCSLLIRPNGPRQAARIIDNKTNWTDYHNYLPLRHATEIRVYLRFTIPDEGPRLDQVISRYDRPGETVTIGPHNIAK
jgi:hypothetical protein